MKALWIAITALALAGCAATGTVAPKSLDESLAYAESQVTAVYQSAATAVGAGTLKATDAQKVLAIADQAEAAIGAAKVAETAGDTATAQGKLAVATSLLAQIAALLPKGTK